MVTKVLCVALENTVRISGGKSQLQLFSITGFVGLEDIGKVLSDQTRFPSLKKLSVCQERRRSKAERLGM
jgi:hypothetical protein